MSDGFANIAIIIMIYFEIGLLFPKPEAIVCTQGPAYAQTLGHTGIPAALTAVCQRLRPCPDPHQQNAQLTDPRRSSYYGGPFLVGTADSARPGVLGTGALLSGQDRQADRQISGGSALKYSLWPAGP